MSAAMGPELPSTVFTSPRDQNLFNTYTDTTTAASSLSSSTLSSSSLAMAMGQFGNFDSSSLRRNSDSGHDCKELHQFLNEMESTARRQRSFLDSVDLPFAEKLLNHARYLLSKEKSGATTARYDYQNSFSCGRKPSRVSTSIISLVEEHLGFQSNGSSGNRTNTVDNIEPSLLNAPYKHIANIIDPLEKHRKLSVCAKDFYFGRGRANAKSAAGTGTEFSDFENFKSEIGSNVEFAEHQRMSSSFDSSTFIPNYFYPGFSQLRNQKSSDTGKYIFRETFRTLFCKYKSSQIPSNGNASHDEIVPFPTMPDNGMKLSENIELDLKTMKQSNVRPTRRNSYENSPESEKIYGLNSSAERTESSLSSIESTVEPCTPTRTYNESPFLDAQLSTYSLQAKQFSVLSDKVDEVVLASGFDLKEEYESESSPAWQASFSTPKRLILPEKMASISARSDARKNQEKRLSLSPSTLHSLRSRIMNKCDSHVTSRAYNYSKEASNLSHTLKAQNHSHKAESKRLKEAKSMLTLKSPWDIRRANKLTSFDEVLMPNTSRNASMIIPLRSVQPRPSMPNLKMDWTSNDKNHCMQEMSKENVLELDAHGKFAKEKFYASRRCKLCMQIYNDLDDRKRCDSCNQTVCKSCCLEILNCLPRPKDALAARAERTMTSICFSCLSYSIQQTRSRRPTQCITEEAENDNIYLPPAPKPRKNFLARLMSNLPQYYSNSSYNVELNSYNNTSPYSAAKTFNERKLKLKKSLRSLHYLNVQ